MHTNIHRDVTKTWNGTINGMIHGMNSRRCFSNPQAGEVQELGNNSARVIYKAILTASTAQYAKFLPRETVLVKWVYSCACVPLFLLFNMADEIPVIVLSSDEEVASCARALFSAYKWS